MIYIFLILFLLITVSNETYASIESGDTLKHVSLDSVVIISISSNRYLRNTKNGVFQISTLAFREMPKILGNSDPLHYSQMLPGISTNGEYDAGIRVWGCETGDNYISINDTPIYGAQHIIGIFSVFNASHFKQMALQKTLFRVSSANRIGALIDMQTNNQHPDSVNGVIDVGLISSQGTIEIPIGHKSHLIISGRGSYLNLLYSSFLETHDQATNYSFYDTNINFFSQLDKCNSLILDAYLGGDNMGMNVDNKTTRIDVKWGNQMISAHWKHEGNYIQWDNHAFYTRYYNKSNVEFNSINAYLPSSISEFGYKLSATLSNLKLGCDFSLYTIEPQHSDVSITENTSESIQEITHPKELSVYGNYAFDISSKLSLLTGLRATLYNINSHNYYKLSPSVSIIYDPSSWWDVMIGYSLRHQFLYQTGISSMNTPLEYWTSCGTNDISPLIAHSLSAKLRCNLPGNGWTFTLEAYYKWLQNQIEYNGTIYNYLSTGNSESLVFLQGDGRNYGINVTITKDKGWLTGWIGYSWSKSLRTYHYSMLDGTFPSSHDRTHEFNVVALFHINKKLSFGITGVYASGTPFTAPKSYMILQDRIIPQFNEHNSNRLNPYYRIDVALNYIIKKTNRLEHSLNVSAYNVTGHKNYIFYYMNIDGDGYRYDGVRFAMRILPSVSYSLKF